MTEEVRTFNNPVEMTFDEWKAKVNQALEKICTLCADALPDCDYWSMWDQSMAPEDAAAAVMEEIGFDHEGGS